MYPFFLCDPCSGMAEQNVNETSPPHKKKHSNASPTSIRQAAGGWWLSSAPEYCHTNAHACHTAADTLQCNSPFCKFEVTVKPTVKLILKLEVAEVVIGGYYYYPRTDAMWLEILFIMKQYQTYRTRQNQIIS